MELLASEKRLQEEVAELTQNLRKKEKDLDTAQKRAAGLSDDEISAQLAAEKKLNEQIKEELKVELKTFSFCVLWFSSNSCSYISHFIA